MSEKAGSMEKAILLGCGFLLPPCFLTFLFLYSGQFHHQVEAWRDSDVVLNGIQQLQVSAVQFFNEYWYGVAPLVLVVGWAMSFGVALRLLRRNRPA